MSFLELAKKRYSVRKFSDKKVEKEKLDLILEAGRIAPTAHNNQPQRIIVLNDEEGLNKLGQNIPHHFNQTLAMIICYDKNESWKRSFDGKDEGEVDASIVTTHMMMQAEELGIGSTWIAHFDPALVINAFNITEHIVPVAILVMGYPSDDAKPSRLHNERFDISHTVFYGSFDNK